MPFLDPLQWGSLSSLSPSLAFSCQSHQWKATAGNTENMRWWESVECYKFWKRGAAQNDIKILIDKRKSILRTTDNLELHSTMKSLWERSQNWVCKPTCFAYIWQDLENIFIVLLRFSSSKSVVNPGLMASEVISSPAYVYHKVKYVKKVFHTCLYRNYFGHHTKYFSILRRIKGGH